MKKAISLLLVFVLCLSLCACGGAESSNTSKSTENEVVENTATVSANLWSAQKMVDDFGDVIEGSKAIIQTNISGDFSNTATASSELSGAVFMTMMDDCPTFFIRLLEYGDHKATYTSYDELAFKVKIGDKITEFHSAFHNPPIGTPPNGDLMLYDTTETIYTALYNGTDVRCIAEIGSSKYNFTLYADNFKDICDETGYITQALHFANTDDSVLYEEVKIFIAEGKYAKAFEYLEELKDVIDVTELQLEVACNACYYAHKGDDKSDRTAWKQFFDADTAVPLTEDEIKEIIVGEWRSSDGATYSTYTENGEYHYFTGGQESNANIPNNWWVENGRLIVESKFTRSERVIYPFYKNAYVFCSPRAYNKVTADTYELYFHNGPLE